MMKSMGILTASVVVACVMMATNVRAAETDVKMLNKLAGAPMVLEPGLVRIAPGDSVHFVATDKGHNIESIPDMIPEGATAFTGKMSEDLTVKFDKPGVYGVRCTPHYGMGMVGLIVVGNPTNEDAAKAIPQPGKAKERMTKLFAELDAQKASGK